MKKIIIAVLCIAFMAACAPGMHGQPPQPPPGAQAPPPPPPHP